MQLCCEQNKSYIKIIKFNKEALIAAKAFHTTQQQYLTQMSLDKHTWRDK